MMNGLRLSQCFVFVLTACCGFSITGKCQEASETAEDKILRKAAEKLDDYFFAMQSIGDFACLYSGAETQVLSQQEYSGTFPFVGFRAVKYPADGGEKKERFWSISTRTTIPSMMSGFAYDELLVGEERWFTHVAGQTQKYKPNPNQPFDYDFIHMDPRVSVLCYAAAVSHGLSSQPRYYQHISQKSLENARETLRGIEAVFSDGKRYSCHVLFDKSQGFMPTRVAITDAASELKDDSANATNLNHMRWKRSKTGDWLPECGENITYFGKTKESHELVKRVSYSVVWISQDELPDDTFSKDNLSSVPGIRMASAEKWLKLANDIKPIDEEDSGGGN